MLHKTLPNTRGFTLVETLVALAILIALTSIAIPSLLQFSVSIRVDNEISKLHRLLLLARNHAVSEERYVAICPLNELNQCTQLWHGRLSVFYDDNKNKIFEPTLAETVIETKPEIRIDDKLQYAQRRNALIYSPQGRLAVWGGNGTFRYCPKNHLSLSRGIIISGAGRFYVTTDMNADGFDENRSGRIITCNE
jgi:type IV fimbrial biogenesis protein FimT